MKNFYIFQESPVWNGRSLVVEQVDPALTTGYHFGPYKTRREAEKVKLQMIKNQLSSWCQDGGETSYWHIGPSGEQYAPPADFKKHGFVPYDPSPEWDESKYWCIRPARSLIRANKIRRDFNWLKP